MSDNETSGGFSRRTFMRATGAATAAGLVGVPGTAAAGDGFDPEFANWRVREARKVWERGFRGRPDRTIGLTDTGVDARHPDVGPWNGVEALPDGDDGLTLRNAGFEWLDVADDLEQFEGQLGPGVDGSARAEHEFEPPSNVDRVQAHLTWSPSDMDLDLLVETADGEVLDESSRGAVEASLSPDETYVFAVEAGLTGNVYAEYEIDAQYLASRGGGPTDPFAFTAGDNDPTADTPKVVGWFNETDRYRTFARPRDPDGHGTHVAGIMAGSGRAAAVDGSSTRTDEPRAILTAGQTLEYPVEAEAGTGVFASAYGDGIDVIVEGPDGEQLDSSQLVGPGANGWNSGILASNIVEVPTVHDSGEATYTIRVRATEGELVSTARLERITVGTFHEAGTTAGDRTAAGDLTLHAGLAPNASILGLQGLSAPTADLAERGQAFTETFNLRAVNMSWGIVGGAPLGAAGGATYDVPAQIKQITDAGVLTVAAAGNSFTPANGNSAPAVSDEAVSVVSTDPLDGISTFSSGGLGAVDEDGDGGYLKPDVTAPGGHWPLYPASLALSIYDDIFAAKAGDPDRREGDQPPIREYAGKGGTSMASPYVCGTTGLVAQAMEEAAPEGVRLPEPADAGFDDAMRLKQVLLATASETAFTAAPYHTAKSIPHAPTYDFGGRDPYEGFGRVNPDAAVDAVSRELSGRTSETVGLDVPEHSRAVAGYVGGDPGVYEVSVDFSHLSGGNRGMAKGDPHIDLFVYDAEEPADNGEPNVVARDQGLDGDAAVEFTAAKETDDGIAAGTYFVVAKLVNVPGVVNGYDVRAHFDLTVDRVQDLIVTGSRADDGTVFTGGQTDHVQIEVQATEPVLVRDVVPADWDLLAEYSDSVEQRPADQDGYYYVLFDATDDGTITGDDARESSSFMYLAEAPDGGATESDSYEFGPVEVSHDGGDTWVSVPGTSDRNVVVAESQS